MNTKFLKKRKKDCEGINPPSLKLRRTKKGFSIGEVMIAMFILVFGIIGAVFLSARSTAQIGDSRNAIIAASLAQEGVELVRNIRDNSVTQETCDVNGDGIYNERCTAFDPNTNYGWKSLSTGEYMCTVDHKFEAMSGMLCASISDLEQLYLNSSTGLYEHDTGDMTSFKRLILIDYYDIDPSSTPFNDITDEDVAAKITSVVTWGDNSADPTFLLDSTDNVEKNCKIGKQCAYAQTTLTSWINYGE